jgi:catechol 2,3-dioxygenase-like lactoylglutathione lyase family enzyme
MLSGVNHVTLSVRDVSASFDFYTRVLGLRPRLKWACGAYLSAGSLWLALHQDSEVRSGPLPEYTHIAFDIEPALFPDFCERLRQAGVTEWKSNTSEGGSIFVLDPDGHKLEVHCSDLEARLTDARERRWAEFEFFD